MCYVCVCSGPKFHLVAESTLRLGDASERTGSFDLVKRDEGEKEF